MSQMVTKKIDVIFTSPAFLGNADRVGQWRSPPFKALLRQWWRVAWVQQKNYSFDLNEMLKAEGQLFGQARGKEISKSLLRLRLSRWSTGQLSTLPEDLNVTHPEVDRNDGRVGSMLYTGYGRLNTGAAIDKGETAELHLAYPAEHRVLLETTLCLAKQFGTLGGRSRNGWGSFDMEFPGNTISGYSVLTPPVRNLSQCLDFDWPHAIGSDAASKALVWETEVKNNWKEVIEALAQLRIDLRTQPEIMKFTLNSANGDRKDRNRIVHGKPQKRHWLSYPVTNHEVNSWRSARLPNSLRFKIRPVGAKNVKGIIYHMPHLPPSAFKPDKHELLEIWQTVHQFLDSQSSIKRSTG